MECNVPLVVIRLLILWYQWPTMALLISLVCYIVWRFIGAFLSLCSLGCKFWWPAGRWLAQGRQKIPLVYTDKLTAVSPISKYTASYVRADFCFIWSWKFFMNNLCQLLTLLCSIPWRLDITGNQASLVTRHYWWPGIFRM